MKTKIKSHLLQHGERRGTEIAEKGNIKNDASDGFLCALCASASSALKAVAFSLCALAALPAAAALNVFATVPEWAALAQEIGGDKVKVFSATQGLQDPHRVEARPSLIARLRNADLVIATGAELEVGWLPLALRESGNGKVQAGQPGYFEAASQVRMLEAPTRLDRAEGDVHPGGNPHIQTDPRNILKVAAGLSQRMAALSPADASAFQANYKTFADKWQKALARWEAAAAPLRGKAVVSQHKAWTYLYDWLGLKEVATLEPRPGMEPSVSYLSEVVARTREQSVKAVIRANYNAARPAEWFAQQAHVPVVVLPFTVGGNDQAKDLFALFDDTVARLVQAVNR